LFALSRAKLRQRFLNLFELLQSARISVSPEPEVIESRNFDLMKALDEPNSVQGFLLSYWSLFFAKFEPV